MDSGQIQKLFLELVQIDSHSLHEGAMARRCREELEQLGFQVAEDAAGETLQGECGNLIATLPGDESRTPLLLASHMDTVQPGLGVKPHVDETGTVWSDGTTVLGADDKAGVTAILSAMRELVQSKQPHGTIQVVFTIAEEIGLQGARHLDRGLLKATLGLSLDSGGTVGTVVTAGPAQVKWQAKFQGKKAHAGVAPERGISAIKVAAQGVARMPHGRVDAETTVNIGSFLGEGPTNVVNDTAVLIGEARSRDPEKLEKVLDDIESALRSAAEDNGASLHFEKQKSYDGFRFGVDHPVRKMAETALQSCGFVPSGVEGGGGSDANIFTSIGVPTINIGIGYEDIHSTNEHIRLSDIDAAARVVLAFCELA